MLWVVALIIILLVLFYWYFIVPLSYWKTYNVPQTKPLPIFGDSFGSLIGTEGLHEFFERVYKVADNVRYIGAYQIRKPVLVVKDLDLLKQILIKDFDHFLDHQQFMDPEADPLWGSNLFALQGQKWREMRSTLSPSFTSSKMKFMFGLMTEVADNFTNYFLGQDQDIVEVELRDVFSRFTNDVIATTAFGVKVDSIVNKENEFYLMGKEATNLDSFKLAVYALAPKLAKIFDLNIFNAKVSKFFRGLIKDTVERRKQMGIVRPDMIHLLMEASKPEEIGEENEGFATVTETMAGKVRKALSNDDITAQALIFFFAGFDTVSSSTCFAAYELAIHQEIQDKLRQEILEVYEENNQTLPYEAITKMKYMDMVVTEAMRKWPVAIMTERVCTKDYTIQPSKPTEKPIPVKEGDFIFIPIYPIHRDPKNYPDPDKFDPERFSDENKNQIHPMAFIPFGAGPRACIGTRFALLEMKAILFYLLLNFKIVPSEKSDIPVTLSKSSASMGAKNGFWFNFEKIK